MQANYNAVQMHEVALLFIYLLSQKNKLSNDMGSMIPFI